MTWATLSGVLPVILSAAKDLCAPRACLSSRTPGCHPERSEGSLRPASQPFRYW